MYRQVHSSSRTDPHRIHKNKISYRFISDKDTPGVKDSLYKLSGQPASFLDERTDIGQFFVIK